MIEQIQNHLEPQLKKISEHSLFTKINTPEQFRIFAEHQVFEVWGSMSFLTALQQKYTRTTTPWIPVGDPEVRYLIQDMLLSEENVKNSFQHQQSYFEMYISAMKSAEANLKKITEFLSHINHGTDIFLIIATSKLPVSIKQLLKTSFDLISEGKPHKIAAALCFSHKRIMPESLWMKPKKIQENFSQANLKVFQHCFEQDFQINRNDLCNSPAAKLLSLICGENTEKQEEALQAAEQKLISTRLFLEGIETGIEEKTLVQHKG